MKDRLASAWVLIVGTVFIALYYWKSHPFKPKAAATGGGGEGESVAPGRAGAPAGAGGGSVSTAPTPQMNDQNSFPWPPEALKEFSLPSAVQQQHHNAILRQFGIRSSLDIDGGESQLSQEVTL